jgi:hypothetical protein
VRAEATLGLLLMLAPAASGGPEPAEVMRRVQRQATASDETADFTMQLVEASGRTRQRTGTVHERQVKPGAVDEMRLIRFHSPPDFQGSGVLTIEHTDRDNDQWIYLPAYHTSRRVPPANRGDRYMGTDFSYEDIMRQKIEEYRYALRGEEACDGRRCLMIEAVPADSRLRQETAYSKTISWVDPERDVVLRVDHYDRGGALFKRLAVESLQQVSGKYRPQRLRMEDFVRKHVTIISYERRRLGTGVPEHYFTEHYLKRGR